MKIFRLPDLGEGLAEAEIREWYVKVGDVVKVDQPLASMETAKAIVDVPSPYDGTIAQLHGKAGDIVQTGALLVTFLSDEITLDQGSVVGKLEKSERKWQEGNQITGRMPSSASSIKIIPAARALANAMQINIDHVIPTGPGGLITVDDVKKCIPSRDSSTQSTYHFAEPTEVLHGVRRTMAYAMQKAHQDIVPVTIFDDADITAMPEKADLSVALIQAMVVAAEAEPALNAWFDGHALKRKLFDAVHIGLAVDSDEGLFVPVLKDAQGASQQALRQAIDTFKQAIKSRSLSTADMQGATITLSNFGMIAGRYATPVIIPPMVAILASGRSRKAPVVMGDKVIAGRILPLSLTFDHRAVTGGEATRFLGAVIQHLEKIP